LEEVFHPEGGDALEQVAQGGGGCPIPEGIQARLDVALGSLVCWLATLHIGGGLNELSIVVVFNPGHSMNLRFYDNFLYNGSLQG